MEVSPHRTRSERRRAHFHQLSPPQSVAAVAFDGPNSKRHFHPPLPTPLSDAAAGIRLALGLSPSPLVCSRCLAEEQRAAPHLSCWSSGRRLLPCHLLVPHVVSFSPPHHFQTSPRRLQQRRLEPRQPRLCGTKTCQRRAPVKRQGTGTLYPGDRADNATHSTDLFQHLPTALAGWFGPYHAVRGARFHGGVRLSIPRRPPPHPFLQDGS
jgi:hypothetical protein